MWATAGSYLKLDPTCPRLTVTCQTSFDIISEYSFDGVSQSSFDLVIWHMFEVVIEYSFIYLVDKGWGSQSSFI